MTYEEARNHFKDQLDIFVCGEHHEAMKVAIESLEKQSRIVEQLEEEKNHCCVGSYEDYDPYEDGRFETYEEVIALLKGVQNE